MIIGGFVFLCLAARSYICLLKLAAWAILVIAVFRGRRRGSVCIFQLDRTTGRPRTSARLAAHADRGAETEVWRSRSKASPPSLAARATGNRPTLFMAYVVAEDLALRQVQQEHDCTDDPASAGRRTPFDALIIEPDELICVEVSFVVAPDLRQEKVDSMLKKTGTVRRFLAAAKT